MTFTLLSYHTQYIYWVPPVFLLTFFSFLNYLPLPFLSPSKSQARATAIASKMVSCKRLVVVQHILSLPITPYTPLPVSEQAPSFLLFLYACCILSEKYPFHPSTPDDLTSSLVFKSQTNSHPLRGILLTPLSGSSLLSLCFHSTQHLI